MQLRPNPPSFISGPLICTLVSFTNKLGEIIDFNSVAVSLQGLNGYGATPYKTLSTKSDSKRSVLLVPDQKLEIPPCHRRTFRHMSLTTWNVFPSLLVFIKQ